MTNHTEPEQCVVRLASLGAVWQQGVLPQEQTTRWTGGPDFVYLWIMMGLMEGGSFCLSNY